MRNRERRPETRSRIVPARFRPTEAEILRLAARAAGVSVSTLIQSGSLEKAERILELIREPEPIEEGTR